MEYDANHMRSITINKIVANDIFQVDNKIWLVQFMDYELGYFDMDTCRVELSVDPFGIKLCTMCQV